MLWHRLYPLNNLIQLRWQLYSRHLDLEQKRLTGRRLRLEPIRLNPSLSHTYVHQPRCIVIIIPSVIHVILHNLFWCYCSIGIKWTRSISYVFYTLKYDPNLLYKALWLILSPVILFELDWNKCVQKISQTSREKPSTAYCISNAVGLYWIARDTDTTVDVLFGALIALLE